MKNRIIALAVLLALMLNTCFLLPPALANVETDPDGGVWDYDNGTYTDPNGNVYPIESSEDSGSGGSGSSGSGGGSGNASGGSEGMVVEDTSGVTYNGDGSMEVESGALPIVDESESASEGLTQEEWEARMQKALNRNGLYTETYYVGPEKYPTEVEVKYVGLARSMVVLGGKEAMVNTCDLLWASSAPSDRLLAVVNAPKQGTAALRDKTSAKAFIMDRPTTGRVVRVLSVGDAWTMVDYDGMRGYMQTAALTFYPNSQRTYDTGCISLDGRTRGKNTIFIRSAAKNGSRHLADYALGTPLTIFNMDEKWCEVDVEGWHCYILTEYVTMNQPSILGSL